MSEVWTAWKEVFKIFFFSLIRGFLRGHLTEFTLSENDFSGVEEPGEVTDTNVFTYSSYWN